MTEEEKEAIQKLLTTAIQALQHIEAADEGHSGRVATAALVKMGAIDDSSG